VLDGYLVVDSKNENLIFYRNDTVLSRAGELPLVYPSGEQKIKSAEGIAIDLQGNMYIVDWEGHRVYVFGSDGVLLRSFGSFGKNESDEEGKQINLTFPTRIAISEDTEGVAVDGEKINQPPLIFIADRNGIHLTDSQGTYLGTIDFQSNTKSSFYSLIVRGYNSNLRLYALNKKTEKIELFINTRKGY
jgi:hypothetical protein